MVGIQIFLYPTFMTRQKTSFSMLLHLSKWPSLQFIGASEPTWSHGK